LPAFRQQKGGCLRMCFPRSLGNDLDRERVPGRQASLNRSQVSGSVAPALYWAPGVPHNGMPDVATID
jgi:hypothetical protein